MAGLRRFLARTERAVVGFGMALIGIVADRRVRRSLDGKDQKPSRHGLHVDIRRRGR